MLNKPWQKLETFFPDRKVHRAPAAALAPCPHSTKSRVRLGVPPPPIPSVTGTSLCSWAPKPSPEVAPPRKFSFFPTKELSGSGKSKCNLLKLHIRLRFHISKDTNTPNFMNQVALFEQGSSSCMGTIRKYFQCEGPHFVQPNTRRQAQNLWTQKEHLPNLKSPSKQILKNKTQVTLHCYTASHQKILRALNWSEKKTPVRY